MVGEGNIMCGMELCTQGTVMTVHERLCVSVYVYARMRAHSGVCAHTCAHIKSFPPIPSLSIMFGGCSSFLSVWLCCCAVMANYLDSLLTALRQLNSQMENRRGNLSEMSSLRVELKSDSSPTCVYNRKSFTGKRDGVCLANCRIAFSNVSPGIKAIRFFFVCLAVETSQGIHVSLVGEWFIRHSLELLYDLTVHYALYRCPPDVLMQASTGRVTACLGWCTESSFPHGVWENLWKEAELNQKAVCFIPANINKHSKNMTSIYSGIIWGFCWYEIVFDSDFVALPLLSRQKS